MLYKSIQDSDCNNKKANILFKLEKKFQVVSVYNEHETRNLNTGNMYR